MARNGRLVGKKGDSFLNDLCKVLVCCNYTDTNLVRHPPRTLLTSRAHKESELEEISIKWLGRFVT
jgi:hypothetical protein